jgi:hypothetical protein
MPYPGTSSRSPIRLRLLRSIRASAGQPDPPLCAGNGQPQLLDVVDVHQTHQAFHQCPLIFRQPCGRGETERSIPHQPSGAGVRPNPASDTIVTGQVSCGVVT